MTHTIKIKETPKSKALISQLRTLGYVEWVTYEPREVLTEVEMIARVKKAEKGKSIAMEVAVKRSEQWIKKYKRA